MDRGRSREEIARAVLRACLLDPLRLAADIEDAAALEGYELDKQRGEIRYAYGAEVCERLGSPADDPPAELDGRPAGPILLRGETKGGSN